MRLLSKGPTAAISSSSSTCSESSEEEVVAVLKFSYEGERNKEMKQHGYGVTTYTNGDVHKGYYEHGKRHGQGTYTFHSGGMLICLFIKRD